MHVREREGGRERERGRAEREGVRGVYVRKIGTYLCFYDRQLGMGGACGDGWSMWGWVVHVGVDGACGGRWNMWGWVEYVRMGGICEGGWSM